MSKQTNNENPEIYALRQNGGSWQISRRDFLKAAGIGAAAVGIGLNSRFMRPAFGEESLEELCKNAMAHKNKVTGFYLSADGKYLLSVTDVDASFTGREMKCWNMETGSLLNTVTFPEVRAIKTAWIDGESCLIVCADRSVKIVTLPDMDMAAGISIPVDSAYTDIIYSIAVDPDGNFYLSLIGKKDIIKISREPGTKNYERQEIAFTHDASAPILIDFWDRDDLLAADLLKVFLIHFPLKYIRKYAFKSKSKALANFFLIQGKSQVLVIDLNEEGEDSSYSLISLEDESVIWRRTLSGKEGGQVDIRRIIPTPDGTAAVIFAVDSDRINLNLISMEDGAVLKQVEAGISETNGSPLAVAADGTKLAVGVGKSIIFYSLPDLKVIGCPVDLTVMPDDRDAVEVSGVDPVSGETITYTLPCGAPIPAGAVCTCNCVAGGVPTVKPTAKPTAVPTKAPCSCNSNVTTYSSHYWHPN